MRLDSGKSRKHANGSHPKDARFAEFTTFSGGGSNERRAGGRKRGAVDTQEAGSVASDGCGGAAAELRDGDDLVHRKLTWRYFMLFGLVTQAVTEASVLHTFQFGALVARVFAPKQRNIQSLRSRVHPPLVWPAVRPSTCKPPQY